MLRARQTNLTVGISAALLSVAMAFAAIPAVAGPGSMHGNTNAAGVTFNDAGNPEHAQSGNMLIASLSGAVGGGGNVRFNGTLRNTSTSSNDAFTEVKLACEQVCSGTGSLVVVVGPGSTQSFIFSANACTPGANAVFSISTMEEDGTRNSVVVAFQCP